MRLDTIRPLYESSGPFVTLDLDVSRDTEDARQQLDARWTTARHELERLDTSEDLRAELEQRLRTPTHVAGRARRTIVAVGDEVLFDDVRAGSSPWPETVSAGPLPDLAGWLGMADGQLPFLLVRADQVLLAAAALTDAEATVVPSGMPLPRDLALASGSAALLRWDERAPN